MDPVRQSPCPFRQLRILEQTISPICIRFKLAVRGYGPTSLFRFVFRDFPKGVLAGASANASSSARPPIFSSSDLGTALLLPEGAFDLLVVAFACQLLTKPEGKAGFAFLGALYPT